MQSLNARSGIAPKKYLFNTDFYTSTEFTDQFDRLDAVIKEIKDKDPKSTVISVKIINLNRQTMPLYKRLDDKNKEVVKGACL